MRRNKFTFFVILLFGLSLLLNSNAYTDPEGYGNARWGEGKATTKQRIQKHKTVGEKLSEEEHLLIVDYPDQAKHRQKKYRYSNNRLVRVTVYYNNPTERVLKTLKDDHGNPTLENNIYSWKFPLTVITHEKGSQKAVFTDAKFEPAEKLAGIDRIKVGMTADEVEAIMGKPEPTNVKAMGNLMIYDYSSGRITFQFRKVTKIDKFK